MCLESRPGNKRIKDPDIGEAKIAPKKGICNAGF
jgi:hypothetical protein